MRGQQSGSEECFQEFECLEEREISSFSKLVSSETRPWRLSGCAFVFGNKTIRQANYRSRNRYILRLKFMQWHVQPDSIVLRNIMSRVVVEEILLVNPRMSTFQYGSWMIEL